MPRILLISALILTLYQMSAQSTGIVDVSTFIFKDTLEVDFYSVSKSSTPKRPLVVLVHGGGFAGGLRNGEGEKAFCETLAGKGYAVASIEYHLTRKNDSFGCDCEAKTKVETFVSAVADLGDGLRFLMSRNELEFDREVIILAGSSAGAETVLHAAYMNRHHAFRYLEMPEFAGVISFAGAILQADYITSDNAVPALLIHGLKDDLVPFGTDAHHFCDPDRPGYLILEGSIPLAKRLKDLKVSYMLGIDPEGNHDWANEGYNQIGLVEKFIEQVILKDEFIQEELELTMPVNESE